MGFQFAAEPRPIQAKTFTTISPPPEGPSYRVYREKSLRLRIRYRQTTNLGVRSSNLFGRASYATDCAEIIFMIGIYPQAAVVR